LIPGSDARLGRGEALLQRGLETLVLPDGGILTRAPVDQLRLLELLLFVQASYQARAVKPPVALVHATERLVPSLKAAVMGDGCLGSWHGGATVAAPRIEAALQASGVTLRALRQGVDSGYQRLSSGRTLIVVDAGPPPVARVAERAHTGTLGFEFSDGANRVVVNCGGADTALAGLTKPLPAALAAALRTTAAHSTLVLADTSSTRIRPDGALGKGVEEVIANRQESEDGVWLDMVHDGYARRFGLLHRRRLFVSANGQDFRGEDLLETAAGRGSRRRTASRFDIRFHLGCGVEAIPTADAQGALLKLPDGRIWAFKARGATLSVDDSVWIDAEGRARPTQQLVLSGNGVAAGTNVNWSFKRAGK
ncbi:MAG: heparinase II/III family protein, partial [Polymorphobacter sp.]